MVMVMFLTVLLSVAFAAVGCLSQSGADSEQDSPKAVVINGYAQKGQLIKGSQITAFALDDALVATGLSFPASISDDLGAFTLDIKAASPYLELRAEGYYFNEVTGELSEAPIYLEALTTPVSADVNVNLFTTVIKQRVKRLILSGNDYATAVATAQNELLALLGVELEGVNFADLDIMGSNSEDALLLAYACIIQQDRAMNDIVSLVQSVAAEFAVEGKLSDATISSIVQNREAINPFEVIRNIADYYAEKSVENGSLPPFYRYLSDRYDADFVIERRGGDVLDVSTNIGVDNMPGTRAGLNYAPIASDFDILSVSDFDVVRAEQFVTIAKEHILGNMYTVSISIAENNDSEPRSAEVLFVDKSGRELCRKEFQQGAKVQIVELRTGAGTRAAAEIGVAHFIEFNAGDRIGVNGVEYDMEVLDPSRVLLYLPCEDSYLFSFPVGSVRGADHIARITVDIPQCIDRGTAIPYYGVLAKFRDMDMPNPASIDLAPAVGLVGFKPKGYTDVSYITIEGNSADDFLTGTFSYVANTDDLYYYTDLTDRVDKGTGRTMRLNYCENGCYYAVLPAITLPNGLTIKMYDNADKLISEVKTNGSLSIKTGAIISISFNK